MKQADLDNIKASIPAGEWSPGTVYGDGTQMIKRSVDGQICDNLLIQGGCPDDIAFIAVAPHLARNLIAQIEQHHTSFERLVSLIDSFISTMTEFRHLQKSGDSVGAEQMVKKLANVYQQMVAEFVTER